ncbi:hypothetical protein IYY11_04415 [Methylocystis sp. H62]|uniref:hypothetical protein n=1 Tax=Methylocystis sp. H62 TaxID=2785789 RepID=UPI0018C2EA26|nr:hypothetical protein [Methylocystis sp. H62]MBG0792667.1 hypothetical protein [Methylocystis sp. H62]
MAENTVRQIKSKLIQITCAAEGPISDDLKNKMLSGKTILVTTYLKPGEGLRHILTLDGFKEVYDALRE